MPADPIHQECTSLQERVLACESLLDVLDGLKYIDGNPVALEDGSGYQLNVVSVTMGENNQWTVKNEEPIVIKHGSKGDDGHTPVVTIQDGNWYIDGVDTGEKAVPADGKDGKTPRFYVYNGELWYTFDAEAPVPSAESQEGWTSLGNVVGPKGETGEQGPQGPEGIHGLEITRVTDVNDPNYGAVKISYYNGEETVTEYLPTYEMFLELKTKVEDAEENISALLSLATALQTQTFVTGYEFIKENGVIVGCKVSTVKVVLGPDGKTYTTQTATSEIRPNDLIKLDWDERGWYWSIPEVGGTASKHYLDAEKTFVPDFEIINGHLYVSLKDGANQNNINDAAYWEDLGTVQTILAGHDGEDAEVTPNDPLVSIEQKDGKVIFTFADSSPIEVPTQTAFAALVGRVTALEQNAATFNSLFNSLKDYEFVKNFEIEKDDKGNTIGFKITFASYTEKYEDGKFVGYDWKIETKTINYKDAGLLSFTVKDGDYYWVLPDGTEIPVDGTFVPEFRINEADGKLYVSLVEEPGEDFSDEDKWKCLGLVTPELAEGDKIIVSVEEEKDEAGKMTGYLVITFRNPSDNDLETLRLPTAAAFKQLQDDVAAANSNIVALQKAVDALEAYDHVLSFEPKYDSTGKVIIGYHFKFKNSGDVYIYDGKTPSVRINEDGNWEVSYDGTAWEEVKDKNGKPVSAIGIQGENGKTPTFKIDENGEWRISWNGGATWEDKSLGQATGKDGDAFFESVTELDLAGYVIDPDGPNKSEPVAYLRVVLKSGKTYKIPTQYAITKLQEQVDQLTSNVSALQQFAESQTYIVSYEENADKTGYILKTKRYEATTNTWVESTITIYHGTNGKDGATPTITIENGNWVINNTDTGVKAAGENGKTPLFKIVDGKWYYSYDKVNVGDTDITGWTEAGQATGADGTNGDAFFKSVTEVEEEITYDTGETDANGNPIVKKETVVTYIIIELKDGSTYKIPTEYEIKRINYLVSQVNSNVEALKEFAEGQTYIVSYEENADKTGYILKTKRYEATTNTWVESTITIYHGTNGKDGATPTITIENGNWVINNTDTGVKAAGENGKTPLFKIVDGKWYYSYDKVNVGDTDITGWTEAGQATGADGTNGDAFFKSVTEVEEEITYDTGETDANGNPIVKKETVVTYIIIELKDGSTYKIPTEYEIKRINYLVSQVNSNVEALKEFAEGQTYIVSYEENADKTGYILKTKKYDATTKTWVESTITIYHGTNGKDGATPTITIDENGYWVINDTATGVKAAGENGKTPKFKIVDGKWYYSYEMTNTEDNDINGWIEAGQATGKDGDAFFENVTTVEEEETITDESGNVATQKYVAYLEFTLIGGQSYKVPTEKKLQKLQAQVTALNNTVSTLQGVVNALSSNQHIISYEKYYENNVEVGYKLRLTDGPDADTADDELIIYHGTDGTDGTTPSVYIGNDGYWYINNVKTDYKAAGTDGKTPTFKIENDQWKVSYDGGSTWADVAVLTSGAGNTIKITNVSEHKVTITDANGATTEVVEYITITLSNGDLVKIPTAYRIQQMQKAIDSLDGTIDLLSGCLEGKTFITDVREVKDQETGYITGYNVTSVTINDLKPGQPQTTSFSSLVMPFQSGDKWFIKVLTGYDSDKKPIYEQIETGSSSLRIEMLNGDLYYSTDPAAGNDSQPIPGEHGWTLITTLPHQQNGDLFGGTLNKVTKNGDYVEFTFGTNNTLKVPVYFESPTVSFFTDAEWSNNVSSVELAETENSKTLYFKVKGSFTEGQNPEKMYATCEGNWVSTNLSWDAATKENGVIYVNGQVEVKPSSGYIGDNYSGKLTLHIPYYSTTGYGQVALSARGNLDYEPLTLNANNQASFTITTDMIPDGQLPVIAYNYGDEFRWIHSTVEKDETISGKYKITVNCDRNIGGARTGTIVVFNQKGGRELLRLKVPQEGFTGKIHNLAHPTGTGAIVPANCYIITGKENTTDDPNFLYMIPAYKGNDTNADKFRGIKKYEELWNDSGNKINIDPDGQLDEMILFTVDGNNEGNAVIAIKDGNDNILWSWHLWFCPNANVDADTGVVTPGDLDVYGSNHIMDRNLGARSPEPVRISTTAYEYIPQQGMFYQWGRKDPIVISAGSVDPASPWVFDANWSPADDSWGTKKTETDPCPPGYKVPKSSVLANYAAIGEPLNAENKDFLLIKGAGTMVGEYPLGGYYDIAENKIKTVTTRKSETQYQTTTTISHTIFIIPINFDVLIKFYCDVVDTHGSIWSSESGAVIEYKKTSYKYNEEYYSSFDISSTDEGWSADIADEILKNNPNAIKKAVQQAIDEMNSSTPLKLTGGKDDSNKNGHQVRCVKE